MIVYLNGQYVESTEARVSVFDRGFLFGDGVYEGLRYFNGRAVLLREHVERMRRSLAEIGISGFDPGDFEAIAGDVLARNDLVDAGMYWQVTRGADRARSHVPTPGIEPTVFACAWPLSSFAEARLTVPKARAIVRPDVRWHRCDIKSINLLPNVLGRMEAEAAGAIEAILHRDGTVTEGASSTVWAVIEGALVTPPLDGDGGGAGPILPGTTRGLILEVAESIGVRTEVRPISLAELAAAFEVMITSSTKLLMAITHLDDQAVGSAAEPGPVFLSIREALMNRLAADLGIETA